MAWDQRYRRLDAGETILPGDEVEVNQPHGWKPAEALFQPAPDPAYTSHRIYRRLIGVAPMSDDLVNRLRDERTTGAMFLRLAAAESELSTLRARVREVVGPFAKAGELFGPRLSDEYDQCIYSPASGDEYSLCGDHLRAARQLMEDLK